MLSDNYPDIMQVDNGLMTIVTVVLNDAKHIEETVSSVIKQDYSCIEYIVVDGGSSDETLSILEKFKSKIAHIISEPDEGVYDAMNKGISIANGSVIGFINSGDYYANDHVVSDVMNIFNTTKPDVIYGNLEIIDHDEVRYVSRLCTADHTKLLKKMSIFHPASFISRECYLRHGFYDLSFKSVADYDFILRLFLSDKTFRHINQTLAKFRAGGISSSNLKLSLLEHLSIRRNRISAANAYTYVVCTVIRSIFFHFRKSLILGIIGKNNYSKLKQVLYKSLK